VTKRDHLFEDIAQFKRRFGGTSTTKLLERISSGVLQKEAAIAIGQLLDERRERAEVATIYVSLAEEAVEVWRPVQAAVLGDGLFQILSANSNSETERWAFPSGSIVRCEPRSFSGGESGLAAKELAYVPAA
jgi:hypothetical protein